MLKHLITSILFFGFAVVSIAQQTQLFRNPIQFYRLGIEYFDKEKYSAAQKEFENAINVAEYPNSEIEFVGAKGKMEMEKVPKAGYEIVGLPIRGIQRKLSLKNLAVPFKLIASLMQAKKLVKKMKPQIAIGVGGYASARR